MFLMINLGERAGSGLPKIRQGWEMTGGNLNLLDTFEPYGQTRLLMSFGEGAVETGKVTGKMMGKMTGKVLGLLAADPHLTIPELAVTLGKSESTIERAIRELRKLGRLQRVGSRKGG
jgi:predicted HTH transcriptional regulator